MKILLLEPDRLLAQQYSAYLTAQGHSVQSRPDAQSGILAADEASPDLVIVELLLAGHSGIEFLYEFRSYSDWLRVPVIVLSSASPSVAAIPADTLAELGVASYLYKAETSLERLGQVVRRLQPVGRRPATRGPAQQPSQRP